jgi:hypothetical protein
MTSSTRSERTRQRHIIDWFAHGAQREAAVDGYAHFAHSFDLMTCVPSLEDSDN